MQNNTSPYIGNYTHKNRGSEPAVTDSTLLGHQAVSSISVMFSLWF